ncbi:family 20 glycosylhydrolase [Maribacter chungangensis]|uniref:beta-N-acetylhexosaminidase n=1 Tax=Maribacter chungangensis TaxID=1069117 RepID=A0ABW3B783_9FLAO
MHKKEQNSLLFRLSLMAVWFWSCFIFMGHAQRSASFAKTHPVIPTPKEVSYGADLLLFNGVFVGGTEFVSEGGKLIDFFTSQGISTKTDGLPIRFENTKIEGAEHPDAYQLQIDSLVIIRAGTDKGAFYGVQTLKQLFRKQGEKSALPQIRITDWPTFNIRGFMHDTGRNYQSVAQLKEQIDILALYKYNTFHWHLTDDPGWRLESKKYPQLQASKAFSRHIGKFYTQADFKDILAYCKERHITVIPEFDIPGHTNAFRKAFGFNNMKDPKVLPILLDLFEELCNLADSEEMPYIHIGTDEVRHRREEVADTTILAIMQFLKANKRKVITWKEGIQIADDSTSIKQLWAMHPPAKGHPFIDSRANYINHLDPFTGMSRLFFQQPTRQAQGDSIALGGILCAWPDNNIAHERDILKQNPIYPSMVFYADAIWNGKEKDRPQFWANLPKANTPELEGFTRLEAAVLVHKAEFFKGKEFPYVKQTDIQWRLIGPFDHKNDFSKRFPVEDAIKEEYTVNDETFTWQGPYVGGTLHLKHFFGFPAITDVDSGTYYAYTEIYSPDVRVQDFWIGFHGWSRSGGRRGGPFPNLGEWHTTQPKIWVNEKEIAPPHWKQPGLKTKTDEIPFIDEDYFYREPTKIALKKGWNTVLLKVPHGGNSWKWMFSCVPVDFNEDGVQHASGLRYRTKLSDHDQK